MKLEVCYNTISNRNLQFISIIVTKLILLQYVQADCPKISQRTDIILGLQKESINFKSPETKTKNWNMTVTFDKNVEGIQIYILNIM